MSRLCTICTSGRRAEIDSALLEHRAGYRRLAALHDVNECSLRRHERTHLAAVLHRAREEGLMRDAEQLASELDDLHEHTRAALERAEASGDDRVVLAAIREARGNLEVYARLGILGEQEAEREAERRAAQQQRARLTPPPMVDDPAWQRAYKRRADPDPDE